MGAISSGSRSIRNRNSGEDGHYVQTGEMGGYVVLNNGDVYKVQDDQGGDAWVGKSDDWSGGKDKSEESITINGQKYRPIKESKERVSPTAVHPFKKKYQQIGGK